MAMMSLLFSKWMYMTLELKSFFQDMGNGKLSKEVNDIHGKHFPDISDVKVKFQKEPKGRCLNAFNVAVVGEAGAGKSCFINAFRNVKRGDKSYAEEDVVETTKEPTPYQHPHYRNLILWDLPGVGTKSFPKEKYKERVLMYTDYDFFLILSSQRVTENDQWLTQTLNKEGKSFFFIRTQVDIDVIKRNDLHGDEVVEKVRMDCLQKLSLNDQNNGNHLLFLINNKNTDVYDFEKLELSLVKKMAENLSFMCYTCSSENILSE
ncbi:interferon-inducible GTPase 1-like [Mercenaria mercenaria]|uniref:interferon-inducible GTPase 1-like n=1 Tax=Mercenaria mercenaria TaxID=6596 RepID=UPI00234F65B0|nr:interferon-inducible GTPase 1-like [Mercenaria mercenaria]